MTRPDDHQDEQVRRLLREARHDQPVPDDVATRLDRVLAQLAVDDPAGAPDPDEVAARRRRRAGGLLVAAAAVVVAAVGIGQVVDPGDGASDDADNAASSAQDTASADRDAASGRAAQSTLPRRKAPSPTGDPVEVHADHFTRDARALLRATEAPIAALSSGSDHSGALDSDDHASTYRDQAPAPSSEARRGQGGAAQKGTAWFSCDPAPWGPGRLLAVRYDGEPAVVAVRPAAGDTRVVEVLQCGTGAILRSVTLPRR